MDRKGFAPIIIVIAIAAIMALGGAGYVVVKRKTVGPAPVSSPVVSPAPQISLTPKGVGILGGNVTIGPLCPVQGLGVECPTPGPEIYTSREVAVYGRDRKIEVARTKLDATGYYRFELAPGTYILDIPREGIEFSKDLPREVVIVEGETVRVDFDIDTGIR